MILRLRRQFLLVCAACLVGVLSGCAFGAQADSQEEEQLLLQTLLLSARAYLQLSLRTGAGQTTSMSDFTVNGIAISLNSETSIHLDKVEINYSGGSLLGSNYSTLRRHGEDQTTVNGSSTVLLARNITLNPIGSGTTSLDIFERQYRLSSESVTELSAAGIDSIKVHVDSFTLKGTAGVNSFTYQDTSALDISLTPTCGTTLNLGATTVFKLLFNYSAYFANLAGDSAVQVQAAALANRASTSLLEEHECLSL